MKAQALAITLLATFSASSQCVARMLTREFLTGTAQLQAPVPMSEYAAPESSPAPAARFEGRLQLAREAILGSISAHRDDYGTAQASQGAIGHLPEFDFELVQEGAALIPLRRGSIPSDNAYWEFILEPGRVWTDEADGGFTRATLPFALQERNANCLHNGVMTFLFDGQGAVSRVAYQISAETCRYFKADMWGVLPASYEPGRIANREQAIAGHAREVAARLPTRPIAMLANDYPGVRPDGFGSTDEIPAADMTAFGFIVDGTHYTGGCATRHGPYPFGDVLDLPSYSLAKSLVAGLATMRLERLHPGTMQRKISDYVPQCARRGRWDGVTFENALDMATGHYTSAAYEDDERSPATIEFFVAEDHTTKLHLACSQHPRRAAPGTKWVYHTTDTYILGTALSAFARERYGAHADFYQNVLVEPLWRTLQLSPVLDTTRRTRDRQRQPFTGWGLVLHRDDIARVAHFLNARHGRVNGAPWFDEKAYAAAMQRAAADRGLTAIDASFRYNNGFWAHDVSRYIGCTEPVWAPYLAGFGGIVVVLLPNDTSYYYFSDGDAFRWSRAVIESNRIRALCKASS